jgi:PhnB protein
MKLHPHVALAFNGQCEAAFKLYEQCFDGTVTYMLTWGNSPMAAEAPPGWEAKIYHASLRIGDATIAGGDVAPDRYATPKGFSMIVDLDDPAVAERAFHALAEDGKIEMPLQETFWAARFGAVVDRFGVPWSINCEKPNPQ